MGGPLTARGRVILAGVLALGWTPSARAATEAEAQNAATTAAQAAVVPVGWTGSTIGCILGSESPASIQATLRAANAYRSVAGLPAVTFDATLNGRALAAALMMRAGNANGLTLGLSHQPLIDNPAWPCATPDGTTGASTSNLALGTAGADAIRVYIADDGVPSLGHRRWVLDPAATTFGTGSTDATNALTVLGGPRATVPSGTQVPWPPAGAIAATWVPSTWSVSIGGNGDTITAPTPALTMTLDGAAVAVPGGISKLQSGFGTGETFAWTPTLDRNALRTGYHQLNVSISGISVNGIAATVAYTTTIGTAPPPPTPTPAPTPAPAPTSTPAPTLPSLSPRITRPRGKLRVGKRLTAMLAQGTGRITTKLEWLRSGRPIKGATSIHHRITRKDLGRTLRIRVTSQARDGTSVATEVSAGLKIRR